jgi:hypothetical protein
MAQSCVWCLLTCQMVVDILLCGSKYLEYNSNIRTEKCQWIVNHWIIKQNRSNKTEAKSWWSSMNEWMRMCKQLEKCWITTHASHEIQKWTVNATLAMGHQADPGHCYRFHILQQNCSTQNFTILFWDWGRRWLARIDSRRYTSIGS